MTRIYLDTSAYLCILLGEEQSQTLSKKIQRKELCSSSFLFLEAERNLIRLSREKVISISDSSLALQRLKSDQALFVVRDFTLELALTSEYPPLRTPRSSDLLHLRTAKWFHQNGGLEHFVTLDQNQKMAALELNLPVMEFD